MTDAEDSRDSTALNGDSPDSPNVIGPGSRLKTLLEIGKLSRSKLRGIGGRIELISEETGIFTEESTNCSENISEDTMATARYGGMPLASASAASSTTGKRSTSVPRNKQLPPTRLGTRSGATGAMDEDSFQAAFEDVPRINLFSARELVNNMQQIKDMLGDPSANWEKRINCMKKLRTLLIAEAAQYAEFHSELRTLEIPFQLAAKDLRSQLVRETCITIGFLSQTLGMKFDHFAEMITHTLINLIQNSAKVMATSGAVACTFIIRHTHSPKLIPIITSSLNSKSREIRRACAEFVFQICDTWPTYALERNVANLQEAIRQALSDADPDARLAARKAYWAFHGHFRDQADALFISLDAAKQRHLRGQLSQSSSNSNIPAGPFRSSQENLRCGAPLTLYRPPGRSTSDIDTGAQRRARGGYIERLAQVANNKTTRPIASPNMVSLPTTPVIRVIQATPVREPKMRNGDERRSPRIFNKSMSQPGSRSESPTSRLPTPSTGSGPRKYRPPALGYGSGLPIRSHSNSREQSPHGSGGRRYSIEESGHHRPPMGRYLSHDGDIAALLTQRQFGAPESVDLESETSSVCSGHSFSTATAHMQGWELSETLKHCQSTQSSERKEGLLHMRSMFKARRQFSPLELKRISDSFSRLFADAQNRVFSLFMDTLGEFVVAYHNELQDWLYTLLIRLLTKQSSDFLASVQTKLTRSLDLIRESFPYHLQFSTLIRYIIDPVNTPSLKMKAAVLNYLISVASVMDSSDLKNSSDVRQAVQKIVSWTAEPKSADVRRASQTMLVTLFSANAAEFTAILNTFPKSYQDSVYRLLQSQLAKPSTSANNSSGVAASSSRIGTASRQGVPGMSPNVDLEYVHDSLKRTSEEIQQYSFGGMQRVSGSQDSGIVDAGDGFQKTDNEFVQDRPQVEQLCVNFDEERQEEMIADILTELSNHNARWTERRKAMETLQDITHHGTFNLWDEHFKTILLILLETLGDYDAQVRSSALRCLAEICVSQSARFRDYAELTVLRVIDAHKDDDKDVVRTAEECAGVFANHLPPPLCLRILIPLMKNDDTKVSMAAIKMVTKAVEKMTPVEVETFIADVVPCVVKAYEHPTQSVIRKAGVVCLVAFYQAVGMEKLEPYLASLNNSKVKLLHLFIKRAESNSTSPTSQI